MTEVTSRPIMENDQALQTALELSMQNLDNTTYSTASTDMPFGLFEDGSSALSRQSKSQNITQCVPVPSSEHVAEIVGRQGCKIKALRAKTNTYIKTPVRGEDPVFVITGRPEDVSSARREVLAAADHFTQIRAARRSSTTSPNSFGSPVEEKVSILVRVPYRVVGLVVGPKGATIKRIQQVTNTYIVTPSRDKEPCFEVAGTPENVERARKEIESYIAMRTGGSVDSDHESDYQSLLSPCSGNGVVDSVFSGSMSAGRKMSEVIFSVSNGSPTDTSPFGSASLEDPFSSAWSSEKVRRTSPLSSAVFGGVESGHSLYSMPVSAPVTSVDSVFDFSRVHEAFSSIKAPQPSSPTSSCESNSSEGMAAISPKQSPRMSVRRLLCYLCQEREVVEGISACEHDLYCYSCAKQMEHYGENSCPVCGVFRKYVVS